MSRPQKWKRVCSMPSHVLFVPAENAGASVVTMPVDEYETIRLIDYEGFTQEECARQMLVARASVQSLYARARRKLALCLVQGKALRIEGGSFLLCEGPDDGAPACRSCPQGPQARADERSGPIKIAVPVDTSRTNVSPSFARCDGFLIVEGDRVDFLGNPLSAHPGAAGTVVADELISLRVDAVLAARCGVHVGERLLSSGIRVYKTVGLSVGENLLALRQGRLCRLRDFRIGPVENEPADPLD